MRTTSTLCMLVVIIVAVFMGPSLCEAVERWRSVRVDAAELHYTWTGPQDATTLRVTATRNGETVGRWTTRSLPGTTNTMSIPRFSGACYLVQVGSDQASGFQAVVDYTKEVYCA